MKNKNIEIKENKKIDFNLLRIGKVDFLDTILPDCVDFNNPTYTYMDGYFYSGIIICNYPNKQEMNWISSLLELEFNADISIFYEKLDSQKVIREITYHIGDMSGAIKTVGENQQDIDVIRTSCEDAKYIRREMQVNKEDLYYLCIYVSVYSDDLEELKFNTERLEGICGSMGLQTRRAIFRQEQLFRVMLPIADNDKDIKESAARNVLTEALSSTYPFVSSELYDPDGVLLGQNFNNKSLVVIDRFNSESYKNANMCILGTSGAGKSFLVKLMILRNRYVGVSQFVVDPDGEYSKVCKALDGVYVKIGSKSDTFVNIMDIRDNDFENENGGYLSEKILKLKIFFSLIFTNMNNEDEAILEEKIIECYRQKGITFDDSSLFEKNDKILNIRKKFISSEKMPVLEDLYKILLVDKKTERFAILLKPYVSGSFSFFNKHTNVDLKNNLIVADIHQLDENTMAIGMLLIIEVFWDRIRNKRSEKKIIYMDEIWRLIGSSGNLYTAEFVYKIFKTIRKFGGGATAITQDISDFFAFEGGKYGRAIINNSALKFILQLEEEDCNVLNSILSLSNEEMSKIKTFERGSGLLIAGKNHVITKVEANDLEYSLINTDREQM